MSMRTGPNNNSSNSNSNNNNSHMSAKRASGSSRISESSLVSVATTSTSSGVNQRQQHVADKSAVKRKKRRKDEEGERVVERTPVVLLTRLEDEKKSNLSKTKQVTEIKVVIERTDDIESIKASTSDKSMPVGKRSTRHSVHRSNESLSGSETKTLEPINEEKEVVIEKSVKALTKMSIESTRNSNQTESKSSKVKIDQKLRNLSVECNVYNVNNDNLNKIDPKIIERQLLVKLDRSQVTNFLEKKDLQRLQSKDELVVDTSKYHSEKEIQDTDVLSKISREIKTCAISSNAGVIGDTNVKINLAERFSVSDDTNKIDEIQQNIKEPVEIAVKKKGRHRKNKNVDETIKSVVKNQRLSLRETRQSKPQNIAVKIESDKGPESDTKINEDSSVQINENQLEHVDESSKDTFYEPANEGSESLSASAVVSGEKGFSKKSKIGEISISVINNEITKSNLISDNLIDNNDNNNVTEAEPVPLPMEVNAIPHDYTVVNDSQTDDCSALQNCDIHSKTIIGNATTLPEEEEIVDKSTKEIIAESTETLDKHFVDSQSNESPIESSKSSNDTECTVKISEKNKTSELLSSSLVDSETSGLLTENLENDEAMGSPTDSFMSCENAELTSDSLIETIEDTESTASTCTLIEETPEELSQNIDQELEAQDEISENIDTQLEVSEKFAEEVDQEIEVIKEQSRVAEKSVESSEHDTVNPNLKANGLDEHFSQEDKVAEHNEHESTFENNLKSVENLVIDSILNGEIVSPKIIARSATNKVEEVQTFVFESSVEDFVNDIDVAKETSVNLGSATPIEAVEHLERAPTVEESPVADILKPSMSISEPACIENVKLPVSVEKAMTKEPVPPQSLSTVESATAEENHNSLTSDEKSTAEKTSETSSSTENSPSKEVPNLSTLVEGTVDEAFAKHRRKHTLLELKKKCTENIDKRHVQAFQKACNNTDHEEPLPSKVLGENDTVDGDHSQVSSNVLAQECYLEQTIITGANYLENISDADSDNCLANRLNRSGDLKTPSLEDPPCAEKLVHSEDEESNYDHTKRQRILMKITKTEANKHVTHLVDSKEEEEASSNEQFATEQQVTEGEIKIIMRKESSSNNHVIKEIKIIPRTPEGGNSARIPGYSPTSSDLSSGNSSCRVPSCSPAKPDSGSYRMPGWSPASTEMGQTTTKKKQGRPKKYPIFTDAELIAKTTAIVNNVDVHSNKLTEKPLFEPVESIRINEDEDVEGEEHQTVITEQMCLSGDQLLEAIPAKPEVLAQFAKTIEGGQIIQMKKKCGRPRKHPLNDDGVKTTSKTTENVTIARIEFNVVDSIEEFVEPIKQTPSILPINPLTTQITSPTKKKGRGRPRKVPINDDGVPLDKPIVGEGVAVVRNMLFDDVSKQSVDTVENHITEKRNATNLDKSDNLVGEEVGSMSEDHAINDTSEAKSRVERRGRKPWNHLKNMNKLFVEQFVDETNEDSQLPANQIATEVKSTSYEANRNTLEIEQTSNKREVRKSYSFEEASFMTEDESSNDDVSDVESQKERRGRKRYNHVSSDNTLSENQVTEEENYMAENEDINDAPLTKLTKRRGRKPWKHLINKIVLSEGEAPATEKRKRGRPRKRPRCISTSLDNQAAEKNILRDTSTIGPILKNKEEASKSIQVNDTVPFENNISNRSKSVIEDETTSIIKNNVINDTPVAEMVVKKKRGRKPFKNQEHGNSLYKNLVSKEANSMTEDESVDDSLIVNQIVENREKSKMYFSNGNKSMEEETPNDEKTRLNKQLNSVDVLSKNQVTEEENSMTENEDIHGVPLIKPYVKRGRKPWKHLKNNVGFPGEKRKRGRPRKRPQDDNALFNIQVAKLKSSTTNDENSIVDKMSSFTDDEALNDTSGAKSLVEEKEILQQILHHDIKLAENIAAEGTTEDETVSSTEDIATIDQTFDRKHEQLVQNPSPIKTASATDQSIEDYSSMTEDEMVSSTEDIPRVEQVVVKRGVGRPRKILQSTSTSQVPSSGVEQNESLTASSMEDSTTMEPPPIVPRKRGRPPRSFLQSSNSLLVGTIASVDTTEDEIVSSTEDIKTTEQHDALKTRFIGPCKTLASTEDDMSSIEDSSTLKVPVPKKRGRKPRMPIQYNSTCSDSMAASSMEDLSIFERPLVMKKRGRKPGKRPYQTDSTCSESLAASSLEDLSTLTPRLFPKKRGRPPKNLFNFSLLKRPVNMGKSNMILANVTADSIEEFSPIKQTNPMKKKKHYSAILQNNVTTKLLKHAAVRFFHGGNSDGQQLSPVKKRGRPPKYPRKDTNASKEMTTQDSQTDSVSASEQSPILEKRRGRLPRRLSQDENIIPSIMTNDVQSNEKSGRSPRRLSHDSGILTTTVLVHAQQNDSEDAAVTPNLGKRQGRPPRKFSPAEEHSFSVSSHPTSANYLQIESDPAPTHVKRKGRPPKKFLPEVETSPVKRKGRPPKFIHGDSLSFSQTSISDTENTNTLSKLSQDNGLLSSISPSSINNNGDANAIVLKLQTSGKPSQDGPIISTTNLLRQQRKPKMAQPQQVAVAAPTSLVAAIATNDVPQSGASTSANAVVKKRGRPAKLSVFNNTASTNLTIEQLRQRRHSQDDSMFTEELPKQEFKERPKEFEDAQQKRKRGRQPKISELSQHFILKPIKPIDKATNEKINSNNDFDLKEASKIRMGRPHKILIDNSTTLPTPRTTKLTAADYLRTWTDRDDSPGLQSSKKGNQLQRRFSQDDIAFLANCTLDGSKPTSGKRLRRYSEGDTIEQTSSYNSLLFKRKRIHSSSSDDGTITHDEKRPRVEKKLCTQHSITKELVVQLTKIDKPEETPTEPIKEIVKMNLRRKLECNSNIGPPPLVPIESKIQPPTHNEAKLLMLMQPNEDKGLLQPMQPHLPPPPQQFCIIFIPDALTSPESALNKDSQPTATIVNFQPVPDAELANKSVIYTPTTPTKIYANSEEQQNKSYLCATCAHALDLVGRLEANVGMTEEDHHEIKCPCCSNDFLSLFHLEYHLRQEHLQCENEKQCRHSGFNTLGINNQDASSESEIYITFALKCRSCYELFNNVLTLNEHVKNKHANLIRHKPLLSSIATTTGMLCYPPPPFKNGARTDVVHCPSDCICRIGIRSTDSPMQRAQVLKRCPNFMRRLEKIEAAAYEVYTCTLCKSTFLMKDEVVEHLMKMHEVSCKFPCTKCLTSFCQVELQDSHECSETTIRDLDKLINIVILPTDKAQDHSKFEDSSNDELGPIKTTPPPVIASASSPINGVKRKNGTVIQKLTKYLAMQPPKKPKLDVTSSPLTGKKRLKTPCPKCQKKFAYRKSLNDHIIFEHVIPCKADEASKNMAVELLRLVNNGGTDVAKIEELVEALGKYTDDDGISLKKLTVNDEQENWNDTHLYRDALNEKDLLQCFKCKAIFKLSANSTNLPRHGHQQSSDSPTTQLCDRCDSTRRRRKIVNNGHNFNLKTSINGERETQQQARYTYECDRCNETFPTSIELNRHINEEHGIKSSDALKCDVCSKVFYSSRMMEKHKKIQHDDSPTNLRIEEDENMECNNRSICDASKDNEMHDATNSSTSRRDSIDNNKEEETCKCPRCDFSAEKVSLKNHLKREHGVMAFICQFCGKLLVEISEVRHMLDYHIKSNRKNGNIGTERAQDDVVELLRTLGRKRLQSLMVYHDFEGKCNNAIMRCPICPEQFATRESCRHHYQWMHDSTCILCDVSFSGGNVAGQHKVAVHNSIASYVWAIQRLVSAIVHSLRLDRAHSSHVLYQEVSMRLDMIEENSNTIVDGELMITRNNNGKAGSEETVVVEPFLEPVVLSEDQLPGSGNMIEVVIGNDMVVEDSEDNLLEDFYLSPNYESSCEQTRILEAGALISELEEEEDVVNTVATPTACNNVAVPATPSITTSNGGILIPTTPVTAENYATSAVFKLRQDNGQEEVVLAITDEDLVNYRDDIGSLAERLSSTCDSLSLEEITTMLRSYFENVGAPQTEEVELVNTLELRTQ